MLKLIAAVALAAAAVPATAGTIGFSDSYSSYDVPFITFSQSFTLPTGFTGAALNVATLSADDLAIVEINGTPIVGAGIFGPGNGYVYYTPAGTATPYSFTYGNGNIGASFSAPFTAGTNTLTIIVNNNYAGINSGGGPLTGGPISLDASGTITFTGGVPEPAAWTLMIAGFGLVGVAGRRRATVVTA